VHPLIVELSTLHFSKEHFSEMVEVWAVHWYMEEFEIVEAWILT
jgi:hypothetical protein